MKKVLFFACYLLIQNNSIAQVTVNNLLIENLKDPMSIDSPEPRFSWQLIETNKQNVFQQAYEIQVNTTALTDQNESVFWSSGKVKSDQSVYVPYKGKALASGHSYYWRVRVWDNYGKVSDWSPQSFWKMGLSLTDWKAKWIGPEHKEAVYTPAPLLRTSFVLNKTIKEATAYITAHGFYEAEINGHKVGDAYLTPGWTSYNKRLQYQAYNVRELLTDGKNAIGVTLGSGWYRSPLGPDNPKPHFYGNDLGLLLQIRILYTDGSEQLIVSDENWKSSTGALRSGEIYNGSVVDARLEQKGWSTASFNDQKWSGVNVQSFPKNNLIATYNEPVTKHEVFKPIKVILTPSGEKVLDFGQNLVGWVKVELQGHDGDSIKISHAEVLDKAGNFYTANLRSAKAQNTYILKGKNKQTFEPQFSWQGFRYVKVEGITGELNPADFTAIAIYSDMKVMGTFSCSNPLLNQLQHNIVWGQKGNFLDVPTDCPQRDERLGWTGDAQVFSRTASFNMDVHNFFSKWLKDVAADQYPDGSIPYIVPDIFTDGHNQVGGSAGWGDVATVIPWNMYLVYGDKRILEEQYSSMKAWVDYIQKQSKNDLWSSGNHFGDWLFYSVNNDNDGSSAITSKFLIAQCFYAYSTQLLINTTKVLGNKADEQYYSTLLTKIKTAFVKEYVTPNGLISSDTQTAYILALEFDMLPETLSPQAAERLAKNIDRYRNHLTTGFLGTPYLCKVLSRFGYADLAYKLLLQETYPSWLYPVKLGATTIWERWDGIKTDGSFEEPSMNSYNHYAYGAIGDWMYRVIAGIDTKQDGVGYKNIIIKPTIGGGLTFANADYNTNYGTIKSHWKVEAGVVQMDIQIPVNSSATVYIPSMKDGEVTINGKKLLIDKTDKTESVMDGYRIVKVGSGKYNFTSQL
ncbi:alpha-L-rhamnosidase [Arcticibacter eurypsychrophilus]|uniref:alpha-L-rhamnosidase n=1 Tax=Arcticibacter eurypsychrophilus TaxID=1434752 RepID=UPI00084DA699|nr:alpha-L-rhamnosidase [Arcticibacter eurypsychrophilus]